MVKELGENIETKHSKEEIKNFCEAALIESIRSFDNFVKLLGIDTSIFGHLKEINIVIDYTDDLDKIKAVGCYTSSDGENNNSINISAKYIDKILIYLDKHKDKYDECLDELAHTIVHEKIHANRDIMIKDGTVSLSLLSSKSAKMARIRNSNLRKELDPLLMQNLNSSNDIILLKVKETEYYYMAYVYNNKNNSYEVFRLDKKKFNMGNYFDTFNMIKRYLSLNFFMMPFTSCSASLDDYEFYGVTDYVDDYIDVNELSNAEASYLYDFTSSKIGIEEALTEAFAYIIVASKCKNELDIKEYCDLVIKDDDMPYDLKLAYYLISNLSIDDIRWFFLSCYEDEYENRFRKLFSSDYELLISNFYNIYSDFSSNGKSNEGLFNETKDVIKRNLKK